MLGTMASELSKFGLIKKLSGRDACIKNRAYLPVVCSFLYEGENIMDLIEKAYSCTKLWIKYDRCNYIFCATCFISTSHSGLEKPAGMQEALVFLF